jgi:hypothetical protein
MATYDLAFHTRLDDVVVLQTFVETGIQVGDVVTIAGAGHDINGTHTVLSTQDNEYIGQSDEGDFEFDNEVIRLFQFLFRDADGDLERSVATGTVTFTPSVSWIQASDVTSWLGIDVATANDTAFITVCVNATNNWCFRKRREAGYTDSMTTVPGADVKLGAIMYAATLYRERGSADSFASFDAMSSIPIPSTMGRIMSLIGCGRPQVA